MSRSASYVRSRTAPLVQSRSLSVSTGESLKRAGFDRLPPWRGSTDWRFPLLFDWCSANQNLDHTDLKSQLRFLSEDLHNALQAIGVKITAAKTEAEAAKAFEPYANKLTGGN
jgi:hypothetical protein